MPSGEEIDVQARAILIGLKALEDLLNEPIAHEALDLGRNAQTSTQHSILQKLRKSLSQYLERDGDLFYVGLLGHFSSGKSSTINSILGAWKTDDERDTGLNPTDTTISLITRHSNVKELLGVIREGHVTIRSQEVDNPILEHVVLADTPGTGDPHLIAEIARDFLPICDVILFLFSATSPLDQTDIPLLTELHNKLPFIPMRFIVTRADELRSDFSRPVSRENLDHKKRDDFFTAVLSRINKLLAPAIYTEESCLLIDNKARYNIDALVDLIKAKCNPGDPQSRILMHSHKLHYYLASAKMLKKFFETFLENKLRELNRIVDVAEQNIQRYNENVKISNSNLTKGWVDQLGVARQTGKSVLKKVPAPAHLPAQISSFDAVIKRRTSVSTELLREAGHISKYAELAVRQGALAAVRSHLRELEKSNGDTPFADKAVAKLRVPKLAGNVELEHVNLIPGAVFRLWSDQRGAEAATLPEYLRELRKLVDDAEKLAQRKSPLAECEAEVKNAQNSLASDLANFFRSVELYRDGVFSHTTKESISTLGIGAQLDALESEFTENDKSGFTADAVRNLFPDFDEFSASALTQLANIDRAMRPIIIAIKELKLAGPEMNAQYMRPSAEAEAANLLNAIDSELQKDVNELCRRLELELSKVLVDTRLAFEAAIAGARRERRRRYITIILLAGIITLGAYLAYTFLTEQTSQSIFAVVGWGLVTNMLGDGLGYLAAKSFDKFPERTSKIKEQFSIQFRDAQNELIERVLNEYEFAAITQINLQEKLLAAYRNLIAGDPDGWRQRAAEHLQQIRDVYEDYSKVWNDYVRLIVEIIDKVSSYFSDATKILSV